MSIERRSFRRLCAIALTLVLFGCDTGPSPDMQDEAYRVGFDLGLADECSQRGESSDPVPSAYDDSLDGGQLEDAFQQGYHDARAQAQPCKCR
jgi:hypothetical protein